MKRGLLLIVPVLTVHCSVLRAQNFIGPGVTLDYSGTNGSYVALGDVFNGLAFPITFEAWLYPTSMPQFNPVFGADNNTTDYHGFWVRLDNGNIFWSMGDGSGSSPGDRRGVFSVPDVPVNRWTHIACVAPNASTWLVYMNGVQVATTPSGSSSGTSLMWSASPAYVGRYADAYQNSFWHGAIDEVRLWNVARTQTEIRDYMCRKISGNPAGLVGYWTGDESFSSTTLLDSALPAEDGTIMGTVSRVNSGAAIGDQITYQYPGSWNGVNLNLNYLGADNFEISNVQSNPPGMQLYRVDSNPYSTTNLQCNLPYYFGVFSCDLNASTNLDISYYYSFANGATDSCNELIQELFRRNDASVQAWSNAGGIVNTGSDLIAKTNEPYRGEYILDIPINLNLGNDTSICDLSFIIEPEFNGCHYLSYLWQDGSTDSFYLASASGQYSLTVTDACGFAISDTINLVFGPGFSLNYSLSDTAICYGNSVTLQIDSGYVYQWFPASGLSCTNCNNPTATPDTSITYYVTISDGSCFAIDSVTIAVDYISIVQAFQDDSICNGEQVSLLAIGADSYSWSPSNSLDNSFVSNPIAQPSVTTVYIVTGANSCGSSADSVTIYVSDYPIVTADYNQVIGCGEGTVITLNGNSSYTYYWLSNEVAYPDSNSNYVNPSTSSVYDIIITNEFCSQLMQVQVQVNSGTGVFIPNAFSPNGDGLNDLFQLIYTCPFNLNYFKIFDRWGRLVFGTSDIDAGWNGIYKDLTCEIGVYVYLISGEDVLNHTISMLGNVTLMR